MSYICSMKKITYLLISIMLLSSCSGLRNTVNRVSVKEGETFVKYGVYGYPDGIEVVKGHECMLTDREIRKQNRKFEKSQKNKMSECERLYKIIDEFEYEEED